MSHSSSSQSNARYARKLLRSGLEGARAGATAFINGERLAPMVSHSVRRSLKPAAIGACLGMLGGFPVSRHQSLARAVARGLLGGAIGLGAGLAWESRHLTASAARAAFKHIGITRDEEWLVRNPIDYA